MTIHTVATINSTPALSAEGGGRDIVVASDGRLWVAYSKKPAGLSYLQIHVAYSDDNGQTWTEERVTFGYDNKHHFFPAIAIDSFENLHLVYTSSGRAPFATRWGTFYRERTIGGWQAEETIALLDVANPGQDYPTIAVGVADVPHVVWAGLGWGANPTIKNIQYRAKIGGTWGAVEQVTDKASPQDIPSIAIDSFGAVHVSWTGRGWGINTGINQVCYGHGPAAWITENVTDHPHSHSMSRIALDSGDNPHIAYYDSGDDAIFYSKRTGVMWGTPEQVSHVGAALYGGYCSIALDTSDNIHIVWPGYGQGLGNDFSNYWYRKKAGAWLVPMYITNQDLNDQWCASLLWASYPEIGGVKTNVLPDLQKLVWEDMSAAILFSETPTYPTERENIKVANIANRLMADGAI
ncbi:MAG: sialidase family protein [Dehalococcoidales bacterium]|nr:sialidase family protein [Dehalococcoidales bacterium]